MNKIRRTLLLAAIPLALAACGEATNTTAGSASKGTEAAEREFDIPASQAPSMDAARKYARGFDFGNRMSARQVYVFFDPQCPHCGKLWEEFKSLEKDARFTWVPVAFLNKASLPQGATIMGSENPVEAMNTHEVSLLGGSGGITAALNIDPQLKAAIAKNTRLLESFGASSVPFIVSRNQQTGEAFSNAGGMPAAMLAARLGWNSAAAPQPAAGTPSN